MEVEVTEEARPAPRKANLGNTSGFKFPPKQYSFKEDQVVIIFHLLSKSNKLKLPEAVRPEEVGCTSDANYCLFHRMVHHPTSKCFTLKAKIQVLIEAGV